MPPATVTLRIGALAYLATAIAACSSNQLPLPVPSVLESSTAREQTVSWTVDFASDVNFFLPVTGLLRAEDEHNPIRLLLLVGTDEGTVTIESESGTEVWRRPDLEIRDENHIVAVIGTDLALIEHDHTEYMISLSTGATLWSSPDLPWAKIDGYLPLPQSAVLLVVGQDSAGSPLIGAVGLADGHARWTHDLWLKDLETSRKSTIQAHLHLMPPLYVEDSLVVVWGTKDGPIAMNPLSGDIRWTVPSLQGKRVTRLGLQTQRAPWIMKEGVIYLPYEKRLTAIDATSGEVLWDVKLHDAAGNMEILGDRIIVQGRGGINNKGSVDLRDMATGESVWGGATTGLLEPGAAVGMGSEKVYLATGKKLMSITLADGAKNEIGKFDFEAGEKPAIARQIGTQACFGSGQNIACLEEDGSFAYRRYYLEPDKKAMNTMLKIQRIVGIFTAAVSAVYEVRTSSLENQILQRSYESNSPQSQRVRDSIQRSRDRRSQPIDESLNYMVMVRSQIDQLATQLGTTNYFGERAVFLTKREDAAGEKLWTIVAVDLLDGTEVGSTSLDGKPRKLMVDPAANRIIAQMDSRKLVALEMLPTDR